METGVAEAGSGTVPDSSGAGMPMSETADESAGEAMGGASGTGDTEMIGGDGNYSQLPEGGDESANLDDPQLMQQPAPEESEEW